MRENARVQAYVKVKNTKAAVRNFHYVFLRVAKDLFTGIQYRVLKFPWPLSSRDALFVVECVLCDPGKRQWFCMYSQSLEHSLCEPRDGFVRAKVNWQGFVGEQRSGGGSRLTWLSNWELGVTLPGPFVMSVFASTMTYPLRKVRGAEARHGVDAPSKETPAVVTLEKTMPEDLTIQDCIIDRAKHKTIEEQRVFFQKKMMGMAREGFDEEDGWAFMAKTHLSGLPLSKQLDVFSRTVPWSKQRQMRSVETTSFATDEVFDELLVTFTGTFDDGHIHRALPNEQAALIKSTTRHPFVLVSDDSATSLMCKDVPFPWPFTPRYIFVVQDYVRVQLGSGGTTFFTYNHDIELGRGSLSFSARKGFVRSSVRYQGLVGVPLPPSQRPRRTRLTVSSGQSER